MKKWFNRAPKSVSERKGYDANEYDWDEISLAGEAETDYGDVESGGYYGDDGSEEDSAYYTEEGEEGGEYYIEEREEEDSGYYAVDSVEEDSAYYAEDDVEEDNSYYAEDDVEEDNTYYAEDDVEEDNTYYAEDDVEEDSAYYAEDGVEEDSDYYHDGEVLEETGYFADRTYYSRDATEDSGDFRNAEDTYAAEDAGAYGRYEENPGNGEYYTEERGEEPGRPAGKPVRKNKRKLGFLDQVILGSGVTVLILALITCGLYISSRIVNAQISDFVNVGSQLDGIEMIGEEGLLAVADAQMAKMAAMAMINENQQEESAENQENGYNGYNEEEYRRDIQVTMELVSIQRDLKIKFVNESTGKLVANVPFAVTVTDPDGNSFIWSDDDMDGIIYKKDITPGNYKVAMEALADKKYSSYSVSTAARTVEVKKDIAYEKVEVANEIKSEEEVDAGQEDTKKNETLVESTLQDTVNWVESSVLAASYSEVAKSAIPDPMTLILDKAFLRASQVVSGGDSEETLPAGKITLSPATVSVVESGVITSQADVSEFESGKLLIYSISPASNAYASAVIDNTGKITITGISAGSTQFIVAINYAEGGTDDTEARATLNVTVTPPKTMTLDKTAATAFIGTPLTINAMVPDTASPLITAVVQDATVASVAVNQTEVTITGLKEGVTNVTVSLMENNIVTAQATCVVTVKDHPKNDTVTRLKDANGNQLYVLENGDYREATYADYYVETNKFYLMMEARYTGWQTIDGKVYFFTANGEKVTGEQIIQGAKYNFASDGSLVTGTGALGIDVSKWNGNIDWNAVKNSGVNYVIIRCGYRGSSAGSLIEDPKFTANIKGATAVGLKVGVYFFTQAIDEREAVEEASMVLELIKNYTISYPVFLDVEASGGRADSIDTATRTAVCRAFCQTIQSRGYTAGIYANKTWLETKIDAGALGAYKIWLAQYAATPTYTGRYDMWQYRSTGSVSGISGDVDMNLSYLGY